MAAELIDVLVIGKLDTHWLDDFRLLGMPSTAATGFSVRSITDDSDLDLVLAERVPQVILSFGDLARLGRLHAQNLEIRRRWVHLRDDIDGHEAAATVMKVYVDVATRDRFPDRPLVSVFTPTYRTGALIERAYQSLVAQTYDNWEWVLYDDSPDTDTFELLQTLARADHRLRLFRGNGSSGVIGEIKRRLCGLARGSVLVELDHDDQLTPTCLASVVEGFRAFPDAGFAYTDCAELFDDGENATYGREFAFGFGSYRTESLGGREYQVTNYPSINSKTVRHIVGMPNHVRAWRADVYHAIGGHASEVHVADDFELCIRTFLGTRMLHIRRFGYLQFLRRSGNNTQRVRNKEIQRLVPAFVQRYEEQIHARFVELGVHDFIRDADGLHWDRPAPDPTPIANYELH